MITYVVGNLFESPARVLVNAVNTVGAMGKGIAREFKRIYPEMFRQYQILCERKQFTIGQLWLYKTPNKWILNFPTKTHWRYPSKPEYIEAGLRKFVATYADKGITSIAFPQLGCGNGELDWETVVKPLMEQYLNKIPIDVFVYLHGTDPFAPEHRTPDQIKKWLRSEPASLPFSEFWEDVQELVGKSPTLSTLTDNQQFSSRIVSGSEEGLLIGLEDRHQFIPVEQLQELWHHIRSVGYFFTNTIPAELEPFAPYLIALLSRLPYLKPTLITRDYRRLNSSSIGLQLLLPSRTPKPRQPVMVTQH